MADDGGGHARAVLDEARRVLATEAFRLMRAALEVETKLVDGYIAGEPGWELRLTFWRGKDLVDFAEDFVEVDGRPVVALDEVELWMTDVLSDVIADDESETGAASTSLAHEPRGEAYRALLEAGLESCDRGLLVVRDPSWLDLDGQMLLASLEEWITQVDQRASWPGTQLYNHTATMHEFKYVPSVRDILADTVEGLYAWQSPFPEDLCLLAGDAPWLVSSAHERDSFLAVRPADAIELVKRWPPLEAIV